MLLASNIASVLSRHTNLQTSMGQNCILNNIKRSKNKIQIGWTDYNKASCPRSIDVEESTIDRIHVSGCQEMSELLT